MPSLRSLCIRGYVSASQPWRVVARARAGRSGTLPICGIFFHRVADDHPNAWTMSTSLFDRQLAWLSRHCDLVSLAEAQRRLREGNHRRLAVAITFDDGYADNCLHAIPALLQRRIPFTYFVTTENVRDGRPFPHDVQAGRPLPPNSIDEIQALADAGVDIGVHTRSHVDLGQVGRQAELEDEILGARADLQEWTGRTPQYFAFPTGLPANISSRAIQLLSDAGFAGFCSAYGGYNIPGGDAFHLLRFHADPDLDRMRNWLSMDPRWCWFPPQFRYELTSDKTPDSPAPVAAGDLV